MQTGGLLESATVMITGASAGLGEHLAHLVARHGGRVALVARREEPLEQLAGDIRKAGGQALALVADVSSETAMAQAFDKAEAAWGAITGVVANAGINRSGKAVDLPMEDFDAVFAINVRGAFITAREAARRMQRAGRAREGRIVLVSSITADTQASGLVAYSASKAAVSHLGKLLAHEWTRTGPNVNVVSPGYFLSELAGDWFETDAGKAQIDRMPRKRLMEAGALDDTILHLLSPASRFMTGANITIDDGQSL